MEFAFYLFFCFSSEGSELFKGDLTECFCDMIACLDRETLTCGVFTSPVWYGFFLLVLICSLGAAAKDRGTNVCD